MALRLQKLGRRLLADEAGGEAVEYVLVLGLIAVGGIAAMGTIGRNVRHRWADVLGLL